MNTNPTSEKAKMLRGEPYRASDPQLAAERKHCRRLIHRFNGADPDAFAERAAILRELFASCDKTALIEPPFRCDYGYNIHFGKKAYANFDCVFLDVCPIHIGDQAMLGPGVHIYAATHPTDPASRQSFLEYGAPVTIAENAWIGGRAVILPGVTIGRHAVVAAGSIVTKDVPDYALVAGNPARIVRRL